MNNIAEETVERTGPLLGGHRNRERIVWQREKNDHYVEPEWCSLRLFEKIPFTGTIVDPSCGFGHIVKSARPSMPPGYVIAEGQKPGNGTTDYAWFVWTQGYQGSPNVGWVRRDGDAQ